MKKTAFIIAAFVMLGAAGSSLHAQERDRDIKNKVEQYATIELKCDIEKLEPYEKELLSIFIDISREMDEIFWEQSFGLKNRAKVYKLDNPAIRRFADIQYGAWDRLDGEKPFVPGFGDKPKGANFYPADMTNEEFEKIKDPAKTSPYTILKRNEQGDIEVIPYSKAYRRQLERVDMLLDKAINICRDESMRKYLEMRRKALMSDDYLESDMIWMDMKDSRLDFVFGPIENYEDALYGYKTAFEAFVLVKDEEWSDQLKRFTQMLPELQKSLPCDPEYKKEVPGTESDLNVYDVVYYAGDCNAGSKTIAINLPNDERVQLKKGTRRLQLKNAMEAKFNTILLPIAKITISPEQIENVKFDAFFSNVCYHEVAHGLGIKNVVGKSTTVRKALKEQYSAWEEAKADICGLYIVKTLVERGEIKNISVEDAYVTFLAGLLRSVRFGVSEAHGVANMMCFNFLQKEGAFSLDEKGYYAVHPDKMSKALEKWAALVIKTEGDGDYSTAKNYATKNGVVRSELAGVLKRIEKERIPIDICFEQGHKVLGLGSKSRSDAKSVSLPSKIEPSRQLKLNAR